MLKLSRTVYSLTRERYLAGCELHIQTLTFLFVIIIMTIFNEENFSLKSGLQKGPSFLPYINMSTPRPSE